MDETYCGGLSNIQQVHASLKHVQCLGLFDLPFSVCYIDFVCGYDLAGAMPALVKHFPFPFQYVMNTVHVLWGI